MKLDYCNSDITEENFPEQGKREKVSKIFKFDKNMISEEAIAEMDKEGYRPATIYELLEWDWDGKDWIFALGSVWQDRSGDRRVPYLSRGGSLRELHLCWFGYGWSGLCRFAAVRKSETPDSLISGVSGLLNSLEIKIGEKKYKLIEI